MKKYFCTLCLVSALVAVSGCRQTNCDDPVTRTETAVISSEAAHVTMETAPSGVEEIDGND